MKSGYRGCFLACQQSGCGGFCLLEDRESNPGKTHLSIDRRFTPHDCSEKIEAPGLRVSKDL